MQRAWQRLKKQKHRAQVLRFWALDVSETGRAFCTPLSRIFLVLLAFLIGKIKRYTVEFYHPLCTFMAEDTSLIQNAPGIRERV
jgi:hypothetical protein